MRQSACELQRRKKSRDWISPNMGKKDIIGRRRHRLAEVSGVFRRASVKNAEQDLTTYDEDRGDHSKLQAGSGENCVAGDWRRRHDGDRSARSWPAKRAYRGLSRARVQRGSDPQNKAGNGAGRGDGQ